MECEKMAKNKIHLDIDSLASITDTTSQNVSTLQGQASSADTHIAAINNPHGVTANQVSAYTKLEVDNLITGVVEDLD